MPTGFPYLGSHDHGRPSSDSQDGNVCLGRDEVQNLSDGLLIRVVTKHYALQRVPGHLCADPIDDALWVSLIHGDHFNFGWIRDVEKVLFLKSSPQGYFTGVSHQDDSNAEGADQFRTDGRKCWRTWRVLRRDDNAPLVAASLLASLSPWQTSRPCSGASAPPRLADRQEEYGEEEQRDGQGEEGKGRSWLGTRIMGQLGRWDSRRMVRGGRGHQALVLKIGGRSVEADKHCGGV